MNSNERLDRELDALTFGAGLSMFGTLAIVGLISLFAPSGLWLPSVFFGAGVGLVMAVQALRRNLRRDQL